MVVIVRYAEIGIKGQNRPFFEKKLVKNIKSCLNFSKISFEKVERKTGRIIIYTKEPCSQLSKVFGISSFSNAIEIDYNFEDICKKALEIYTKGTFRITASCLTKCELASQDINKKVGAYIVDKTKAKVSLKNPDINIGIEILSNRAYLFKEKNKGPGGLPVGTQGLVAVLLEDKDSIKAAILMMKRGCNVLLIKSKKDTDITELFKYDPNVKLSNEIPSSVSAIAVSEKLSNFKGRNFNKPVLRPLVGEWQE